MPVCYKDVKRVVGICERNRHRVRYGVLSAAISTRVGNPSATSHDYANATVVMLNTAFEEYGGKCPSASWVVAKDGCPTGYGTPPNPLYHPWWTETTPICHDVGEFLAWLDATERGWDANLCSSYP